MSQDQLQRTPQSVRVWISKRLPPLLSPSIVTMPCLVVDAVAHRDIDAFVWYNKNVQRLFEIVVCPIIPYRCPRILLQVPYVLGSIFTQRKWKNTNRRRTSPETPQVSRIMNCLGRRGAWKMDGCRKYNIRTKNKRVSIRSSARTDPLRQDSRNVTIEHFVEHPGICLFCPPSATRHNHGCTPIKLWESTVLLEPRIRYQVSTQPSHTTYAPWHTFDERKKWSWWGTYLPAVLMVFRKLIIIPLSDAMCRQSLWPHREMTQELLCAR